MAKKITLTSIDRQKKRAAIQVYFQKYPNVSDSEMANIFGVSRGMVSKWKNRRFFTEQKRNRKSNLNSNIRKFLIKKAANKFTGIDEASSRKLSQEIMNKFSVYISKTTVNKYLNKILNKPKKATTTFILKEKDKTRRIEFANMILDQKISGKSIFFTDEKRFILNPPLNRQTNQIRLNNEGESQYRNKKGKIYEMVAKPQPKFSKGIMVAGGLSYNGVGKLIFITGTMRSFSYLQALKLYRDDIQRLGVNLYFQQDNAPCHTSKSCQNYIETNFPKRLSFWPANSPDLSPIEELWALVQEKLSKYTFNDTNEMVKKLQTIWNRIPKKLCQNLVSSFDRKIELIKQDGERANKRKHFSHPKIGKWINRWNDQDSVERIIYNEKELELMKARKIKQLKQKLKEIKKSFQEEKTRYSKENKDKIYKESKELFNFFLQEEKKMKELYDDKIDEVNEEIKKYELKDKNELFKLFTEEEKINSISIGKPKKVKNLESTQENTI